MSEPDAAALRALGEGFEQALDVGVTVGRDGAGTPVVDVPVGSWSAAATYARDELCLTFLDWLSAVDEPAADPPGVDVVLHVATIVTVGSPHGPGIPRLLMRTRVPDAALRLPSLTGLWPGVAWHERETFEMFGVVFEGFDDGSDIGAAGGDGGAGPMLRPLLLPDGFEGTPLRKSFVLAARAAKPWPGAKDPADGAATSPSRRRMQPPGVPDPSWGPRGSGEPAGGRGNGQPGG